MSRADSRPTGRHRAPDEAAPQVPAQRVASGIKGLRTAIVEASGAVVPAPRSARHRAGSYRSDGAARKRSGAHRAPAANQPVETLLRAARSRPQVLLGALVAAGLLLTAVPIPQDSGESTSVMTAAAEAVGVIDKPVEKKPAESKPEPEAVQALPAARPSPAATPAPARSTPDARRTESKPEKVTVPAGDGPFNSLRTTGSRVVMLSFDDGPDPQETPKILDLLEKHQVKAVFCLVGTQARRHPDLVRRIAEAGHVLCNHTWSHDLKIGTKKPDQIRADLGRTNAAIRAAAPGVAIPYFRAPGGNFTDRLVTTAYGDGMTSLYWEVDPRDWEHPEGETSEQHVKRIVAQVKKETRPGAIVLSHDFNQPDTTTAYTELLPWLVSNFEIGVPGAEPAPATPSPSTPAPETPETPEAPEATPSLSPSVSAT
ncbi:polysaccharide deacetylase family protein [Actinoplanes utahensis]|uniref:polysaccharide deacetylase family protein n=1 Tax=Actinoplanes utahensis TaxID=1869 RepID=UPI0007C80647|nr:polysaccharide deacetylase family protein [Actinoplanes utahensis]